MANTHQSYSYSQSSPFVAALRLRAPRRRAAAPAWRVACAAALAASAAATACGSTDARLESDACHRQLVGFGAVAERFAHYQQQYTRNATAALAAVTSHTAIERATALAKQQQTRFATRQQQLLTPSKTTTTTTTTTLAPLRTKAIQHEYELQSVIGEGGFGRVHAARHRATNAPVALKRVFKATTTREQFLHEVAILQHVRGGNTNVLQLRDAFETSDAYVLVTDLVAGGELFDALLDDGAFDECRAQLLVRELASALSFLHDRNVVHGDVKPENVLCGSGGCGAQLVDFGQAFRADEAAECARALGSGFGTTAYAAPEFLGRSEAGPAADMWALGVVLFVVLCGRHPFDPTNTLDDDAIATRIRSGVFAKDAPEWLQVSASARDLVERLLTLDPRMRFTAEQVLKHDWLASDDGAIAV